MARLPPRARARRHHAYRRERGIPPLVVAPRARLPKQDRRKAARVGVTRSMVHLYRKTHGIPGPPRAPRPPPTIWGWRLTLATEAGVEVVRYAVATEAPEACRLAIGSGEVLRVERVGEVLGSGLGPSAPGGRAAPALA